MARSVKSEGTVIHQSVAFASSLYSILFLTFAFSGRSIDALESEWILNTHVAGAFALLGFFAAWQLYDDEKSKVYWICGLINLPALALSKSWAAAAALILGAGLVAYRKKILGAGISPRRAALIAGGFITAILGLGLITKSATLADRLDWWRSAAGLVLQNPVAGAGSFEKLSPFYVSSHIRSPYAHNYILQMAAEYGMIAALFMAVFLGRKLWKSGPAVLGAGLAAVFALNTFDFAMNVPGFLLIFFILLATAESGEMEPADPQGRMAPKLVLAGVLLCAGWFLGIKPATAFYWASRAQNAAAAGNMGQAEQYLQAASRRDPVRTDLEAQLSALSYERYRRGGSAADLAVAIGHGKRALAKDPLQKIYYLRMQTLLKERRRRPAAL